MKIESYARRFDDNVYLIGEKLPEGIQLADPCYPCVVVSGNGQYITTEIMSDSDSFWGDADRVKGDKYSFAVNNCGGREKVEEMLREVIEKWMNANLDRVMTPGEVEDRWGLKDGTIRAACTRGQFDDQIERGLVRKSKKVWLLTDVAVREVYGEEKRP
jgi:hypothetical protein